MGLQDRLAALTQNIGPVASAVTATLLIILGIIIITHPPVLRWIIGVGFVLLGTAVLALVFAPRGRSTL